MLAYFTYDGCLYSSLAIPLLSAVWLVFLAFKPRFSLMVLGNAILLLTVFAPLATNRLSLGTRIGVAFWLADLLLFLVMLARSAMQNSRRDALAVLASLLGLVGYGLHVLVFSAVP